MSVQYKEVVHMDQINLILVMRGGVESCVAAVAERLGGYLEVRKVFAKDNGLNTILHVEAPLGHEAQRWMHEPNSQLIWVNTSAS